MNRTQRHSVGKPQRDTESVGQKDDTGPKTNSRTKQTTQNRCSYAYPERKSFGQLTESSQCFKAAKPVCNASVSAPPLDMQKLRKSRLQDHPKFDHSHPLSKGNVEYYDGTEWQIIDDIDKYIQENYGKYIGTPACNNISRAVHIAEIPRVKIIAEKYSRYKQNDVELRKLDEKVVCVEYDVFDREADSKPIQVMRAFFSIKPVHDTENGKTLRGLPSALRNKFDITFADLQKLSEKEVQIIDGKIAENLSYLDDLRKILRYKQTVANSTTLDLQTLYEIAHTENFQYRRNTDFLSNVELQEVKDLILRTCRSSVYGFNRKTVHRNNAEYVSNTMSPGNNAEYVSNAMLPDNNAEYVSNAMSPGNNTGYMSNAISQSLIRELLRNDSLMS